MPFMPLMPYALRMRLLIIGGGNMGGAIVRGAIDRSVLAAADIGVVEIDAERRMTFERLGSLASDNLRSVAGSTDPSTQIVLAVKPQVFPAVAQSLHDAQLTGSRIFISIMAGIECGRIHQALGPGARIVRCMPNTPCQIGRGMTAIALGMGASEGDERLARQVFDALGETVMLEESLLNAVTAVSGSGPAYIYLMAEAMQQAAEAVGIPSDIAKLLVTRTIAGAAAMLLQRGHDAATLRHAVTSPAGTTAAALRVFDEHDLQQIVIDAVRAARDRGIELNG